jgi:hypothetical protein
MTRHTAELIVVLFLMTLGCGGGEGPSDSLETDGLGAAATTASPVELEPDDPSLLRRPFTADEIRDEWVEGFRLLIRRTTPVAVKIERWTVISADDEGAEIEYAIIDEDNKVSESAVRGTTWVELRDHASFPAATATREWVTRSTGLGTYDGWLYRVIGGDGGAIEEYFFVPSLPGAPLEMKILDGDTTVFTLEQMARLRPDAP